MLRATQVAAIRHTATATYVSTVNVHTGRETSSFSVPFSAVQASGVELCTFAGSAVSAGSKRLQPMVIAWQAACYEAVCVSLFQLRRFAEVHAHSSVKLQVIPVPSTVREGTTEQSAYLLAGAAGGTGDSPALQLLPATPTAQAAFAAMDHDMYFWRHDATTGEASAVQLCFPLAVH